MSKEFNDLIEKLKNNDYFAYVFLLKKFININYQGLDGNSLLHACIEFCNYPALLHTLSRKANLEIPGV